MAPGDEAGCLALLPMPPSATLSNVLRLLLADADREVRVRLMVATIVVSLGGLLAALAPLALKALVDLLAGANGAVAAVTRDALGFALGYVATLCAGRLLNDIRPLMMGAAEQRLHARLSRRLFAHLLDLPASFHLDRRTGALSQSLAQSAAASQTILANIVQSLPLAVELATVVVILAHLGQPALVFIFVVSAGAYAIVFRDGTGRVRRRSKAVSASALAAHATVADTLLNIETIKCFNANDVANRHFAALTAVLERSWLLLHHQRLKLGLAASAIFATSVSTSFIVAIAAVEGGTLSLGGFVLATVYILQMARPIETLGAAARDIGQAIEFIDPALQILGLPAERARTPLDAEQRHDPESRPIEIRLQDVHLSYAGGPPVLSRLNLHIPAGQTLAIVGPSGSGKSSLARLLLGLVAPDSGQILFDQVPGERLGPAGCRALIGVVAQDVMLFDDTIAQNVGIGRPQATRKDIEDACRVARVHDFIQALPNGYDTRVGERGLKLSGGERQRIAIARAILKRPNIYLFDEATSALDSHTEAAIVDDLRRICRGRTTIMITHRMAVAQHADRLALLQDGRIQECGTHRELLERRRSTGDARHRA
jgi:ABC-type multidrug transport system fused ATPase/permease subunit